MTNGATLMLYDNALILKARIEKEGDRIEFGNNWAAPYRKSWAVFSPDYNYRYVLYREWKPAQALAVWIGLNPSTADAFHDDPTIRRCINFSKLWGYGRMIMLNIFARRSTDPNAMKREVNPVGKNNDMWIEHCLVGGPMIVAAWGSHGGHLSRSYDVRKLSAEGLYLEDVAQCLGTTAKGEPKHPLYLPTNSQLRPLKERT